MAKVVQVFQREGSYEKQKRPLVGLRVLRKSNPDPWSQLFHKDLDCIAQEELLCFHLCPEDRNQLFQPACLTCRACHRCERIMSHNSSNKDPSRNLMRGPLSADSLFHRPPTPDERKSGTAPSFCQVCTSSVPSTCSTAARSLALLVVGLIVIHGNPTSDSSSTGSISDKVQRVAICRSAETSSSPNPISRGIGRRTGWRSQIFLKLPTIRARFSSIEPLRSLKKKPQGERHSVTLHFPWIELVAFNKTSSRTLTFPKSCRSEA